MVHNISNHLDAWLTFLISDDPEEIVQLVNAYPEFLSCYQDIVKFRTNPKELITMYSEALRILDRNTSQLMVEDMQEKIKQLEQELQQRALEAQQSKQEMLQKEQEMLIVLGEILVRSANSICAIPCSARNLNIRSLININAHPLFIHYFIVVMHINQRINFPTHCHQVPAPRQCQRGRNSVRNLSVIVDFFFFL